MKFKKFILDFDHTLFNDSRFMQDVFLIFNKYGATRQNFDRSYEESKKPNFWNPLKQAGLVFKKIPKGLKRDINYLFSRSSEYIFDDVWTFFKRDKSEKILLSCGEKKTQLAKIKNSGIDKYFKSVIITADKLKTNFFDNRSTEPLTAFVDDRVAIINNIKSKFPSVFCTLIKRPGTKFYDETAPVVLADITIKTLLDLIYENNSR